MKHWMKSYKISHTDTCFGHGSATSRRLMQRPHDGAKADPGVIGHRSLMSTTLGDEQRQLLQEYGNLLQGVRDVLQRSPRRALPEAGSGAHCYADVA
eukprot:2534418-Amphidinium_carterae.1